MPAVLLLNIMFVEQTPGDHNSTFGKHENQKTSRQHNDVPVRVGTITYQTLLRVACSEEDTDPRYDRV